MKLLKLMRSRKLMQAVTMSVILGASVLGATSAYAENLYGGTADYPDQSVVEGKATTNFEEAVASGADFSVKAGVWDTIHGGFVYVGDVTNNKVNISNATVNGSVYGGEQEEGSTFANEVTIKNSTVAGEINGGLCCNGDANKNKVVLENTIADYVHGGQTWYQGACNENSVTVNGGSVLSVYGAYSYEGAKKNTVNITNADIGFSVYGAFAQNAAAEENIVNINACTIEKDVCAGTGWGVTTHGNILNISGDTTIKGVVIGGEVAGVTSDSIKVYGNEVHITGGDIRKAYGAHSNLGEVYENKLEITDGTIQADAIAAYGAYEVHDNELRIKNSYTGVDYTTASKTIGGSSLYGCAYNNKVTLEDSYLYNCLYGGYSEKGTAKNNVVEVIDSGIYGDVIGGYALGDASANSVSLSNETSVDGNIVGGSSSAIAANNIVNIKTGFIENDVVGGAGVTGAHKNNVALNSVLVQGSVIGGDASKGNATENSVTIIGENSEFYVSNNVYGAKCDGDASKNSVVMENKRTAAVRGTVYGAYAKGNATENSVTSTPVTIDRGIIGGYSESANAKNNVVDIVFFVVNDSIYGGHAEQGEASGNRVMISSINSYATLWGGLYGGYALNAADNNYVEINGGKIKEDIYSAYCAKGEAENNIVIIKDSTLEKGAAGAYGLVSANNNTVVIGNSTVGGNVIGGMSDSNDGMANYNTVELQGNTTLKHGLYGGYKAKVSEGNTLNVTGLNNSVNYGIAGFDKINFYIPKTVINGDTMLAVTGDAAVDLKDVAVNAGVEAGTRLHTGDKINLLKTNAGIENVDLTKVGQEKLTDYEAVEFKYALENGSKELVAKVAALKLTEEAKSPVETQAAGMTMLTAGADMLAGAGFENASVAVASEVAAGASATAMTPFAAMGGTKAKVKSGSHVDVKGWNLNIGLAKEIENKAGKLLIGPVVEYGRGSYDSYLDNDYHGEGDTHFVGGGVMAKQTAEDGVYYEGSLRAGKLSNDYKSGTNSYDSDSTYLAAHIGIGKVAKLSKKASLDYYGKYFYTHQYNDDTILHAGGLDYDLHFDGVDSHRTRIGGRYTYALNAKSSVYAGLAWQHEFSGTARATINGTGTPAPSIKGNTGIMELGWKTSANKNFGLDLSATGSVGKQKGVGMNLGLQWMF